MAEPTPSPGVEQDRLDDLLDRFVTETLGEAPLSKEAREAHYQPFHDFLESETCEAYENGLREGARSDITCQARKQGTPGGIQPADCDWPFCGCDAKATEVLGALQECGKTYEDGLKAAPVRKKLPRERFGTTHKFQIGGPEHKGYITVNRYPDGKPGEVFVRMAKTGSTINGLLDSLAIVISIALQHGVPLEAITSKLAHTRFEPSGFSGPELGFAKSVADYLARWLEKQFIDKGELQGATRDESISGGQEGGGHNL